MNSPEHGKKSQGNLDTFGKPIIIIIHSFFLPTIYTHLNEK